MTDYFESYNFCFDRNRNRSVREAKGFQELSKSLNNFMQFHNFNHWQIMSIFHMLNDFYAMGIDLDRDKIANEENKSKQ